MFNYTVTLGDLLTILGFALAGGAIYARVNERLARLETKIEPLWKHFTSGGTS